MIKHNSNNIKTIYLDKKTLELLDKSADNLSISRSALIMILIYQFCKDKEKDFKETEKQIDLLTNRRSL